MFVYMDGEYQCNRNRNNLKIPDDTTTSRQTEVDFRVRQKEEIQANGTFAGSQWKFRELNIGRSPFTCHVKCFIATLIMEAFLLRCKQSQILTRALGSIHHITLNTLELSRLSSCAVILRMNRQV